MLYFSSNSCSNFPRNVEIHRMKKLIFAFLSRFVSSCFISHSKYGLFRSISSPFKFFSSKFRFDDTPEVQNSHFAEIQMLSI